MSEFDNNENIDDELQPEDFVEDTDPLEEIEIEEVVVASVFPAKKINYLNNKDMLKEIHKSKNTFCEYTDPKYGDYRS